MESRKLNKTIGKNIIVNGVKFYLSDIKGLRKKPGLYKVRKDKRKH